jgi:hypothetical protein
LHNEQEENKVFVNLVSESISAIFARNKLELQRNSNLEVQAILRALMAEHETYSRSPEEIIQSLTNNLRLFDNIIEREFDALKKKANFWSSLPTNLTKCISPSTRNAKLE